MIKESCRALALLFVGTTLLSSCSMLTAQGRRECAYERYVRKSSLGRVKQQKRFAAKKTTMPVMQPTEPMVATEVSGPESVGKGGGE
jgi:hypothetical protein